MSSDNLIKNLSRFIDLKLAKDLIKEFMAIRKECLTKDLGKSSIGKFIETVVQVLQFLDSKTYDNKPDVDQYLRTLDSKTVNLNDDLKICCSRIARACYTLRNKRSICHKGGIDPNMVDLKFLYSGAQWILSELVRQVISVDMNTAEKMINFIQIPADSLVEDFGSRKLVYGDLSIADEILVLLHSVYPNYISSNNIYASMDRRSKPGICNALKKLWKDKLINKEKDNLVLTRKGLKKAVNVIKDNVDTDLRSADK